MQIQETAIPGVLLIEPRIFEDERGFFFESYHEQRFTDLGLSAKFVQDNHSQSQQHTLRGLHYQLRHPQGKLVRVVTGEVFDVAVDIRQGSPTFGKWHGEYLSAANKKQLYVPPGFAHGFCVVSPTADLVYKCTDFYDPQDDYGLRWNDPDLNIIWPTTSPRLSAKDAAAPHLSAATAQLPTFESIPIC
jgi:dTDP-4-dehydrorhamnose 3,5-epimerase